MTILCIIGPSGSGKTTLAEALVPTGIDTIRSYTTRPMRPGEQNGREHIFIDEQDAIRLLTTQRPLAYTLFGGYRYFALWSQLPLGSHATVVPDGHAQAEPEASAEGILTYVIDEHGYGTLLTQIIERQYELSDRYGITLPRIDLLPIRIERSEADLAQTIDPARRRRDLDRPAPGTIPYRIHIHNDAPTAIDLTAWAQQHLSPALRVWISAHTIIPSHHRTPTPTHLHTHMTIAEIIAYLNGAI